MSQLTDQQVRAATKFNKARHYPRDMWKRIQERAGVPADGIPGPRTARAVAVFQAGANLGADGMVGRRTLEAMGIEQPTFDAVKRLPGESVFFYHGKMAVDADGAPNAYNEQDTGIDALGNAGKPGHWWGIAVDKDGNPYKQGPNDPFPGYYVSCTALCDKNYADHDPRRYVDATKIPYVVLGKNLKDIIDTKDLRRGDLAAVCLSSDPDNIVFAIYAETGPAWVPGHVPGEGSVALAQALGHDPYVNGRVKRGMSSGVFYVVFPGSGERRPLSNDEIQARGRKVFEDWGGADKLRQAMKAAGAA